MNWVEHLEWNLCLHNCEIVNQQYLHYRPNTKQRSKFKNYLTSLYELRTWRGYFFQKECELHQAKHILAKEANHDSSFRFLSVCYIMVNKRKLDQFELPIWTKRNTNSCENLNLFKSRESWQFSPVESNTSHGSVFISFKLSKMFSGLRYEC